MYDGPPEYADVPLDGRTEEDLADGGGAVDPESFSVGLDMPRDEEIPPGCEGTQGLKPFPVVPGCPPEVVYAYPPTMPNPKVAQRGIRVFSEWGNHAGGTAGNLLRVETPPLWNTYRMVRSPKVADGSSRLWMVDIWAYERIRLLAPGAGPVTPEAESNIMESGGASRATLPGNQSSKLKARIMWWSSSGGTTRIVDIGQGIRLALEASLVTVEILYPNPGTIQLKQQSTAPTLGSTGGTILDSEVGCSIVPTTSTPGVQLTTNTIVTSILQGQADVPVFIPPGSRELTIYQSSVGDVFTPLWRHGRGTDPSQLGPETGVILLGADRRVVRLPRPGNAGILTTGGSDANNDRIATFVFGLEI